MPEPMPSSPWHRTQSCSAWQLVQVFIERRASRACWTGPRTQTEAGGWNRPAARTRGAEICETPRREWHSLQNVCVEWQLVHCGLFRRAICAWIVR